MNEDVYILYVRTIHSALPSPSNPNAGDVTASSKLTNRSKYPTFLALISYIVN